MEFAEYTLNAGYIDNWLIAGPLAVPVADLSAFAEAGDLKLAIVRHLHPAALEFAVEPAEGASFTVEGQELRWRYYRCREDHLVDLSGFYHTPHYLRAWAYARVRFPQAGEEAFALSSNGPAELWLNGELVQRVEHFSHQIPATVSFCAPVREGENELLLRFEAVAMRECPLALALRLPQRSQERLTIRLPTLFSPLARRRALEQALFAAYTERDTYSAGDVLAVLWPEEMKEWSKVGVRVRHPSGRIYCEAQPMVHGGFRQNLCRAYELPDGLYEIVLMAPPEEYYVQNLRLQRSIGLQAIAGRYSSEPYGTYEERRLEALHSAIGRESLWSEVAKMALGRWSRLDKGLLREVIRGVNERRDCSDFQVVGLLGIAYRFLPKPEFPEELRGPIEEAILGFKYWHDEPGADAMCYHTENHAICFHTAEILAGQLYPERVFPNSGQPGTWHRQKGEQLALEWLRRRGASGFQEWDSNCYFDIDVLALSHLADLAENVEVRELAAVVLDKLLFTMAVNSFRGVFGSTHGRTYAPLIKSGRGEHTAGIGRLLWGMGVYNQHLGGTVSLACAENYSLPEIIVAIAQDVPEELWSRESHCGQVDPWGEAKLGLLRVNKVTYKTPDYMLCSAQDYHPGKRGYQEHIWQATLGADAVAFVTHPACLSEDGSRRPNFWAGNYILPRVAQWKDLLIALHWLPDDDWLGFTHAYFPLHAFDEHALEGNWAFARKGNGYLALFAANGLELVTRGNTAYRELRSRGQKNIWLCHMGRAALDGSFAEFQAKVLSLPLACCGLEVQLQSLRGQSIAFSWEGPFLVDGREQPLRDHPHYENPYCTAALPSAALEIRYGDTLMRLRFA
jgi:hypothetical protein